MMKKSAFIILLVIAGCGKKEPPIESHLTFPDPPSVVTEVIRPDLNLPDSLGGTNARGWIDIITKMNVKGRLLQYEIGKIKISLDTSEPKTIYSIYDGVTSDAAKAAMKRYLPWVDLYLEKAKFKIKYDTSYYKFSPQDTLFGAVIIKVNANK
jgi:hypothetical protein